MPSSLKSGLCSALSATGLDAWMGWVTGSLQRPWVVGYHAVVEDAASMAETMPGLSITAGTFEQHLDWIGRHFQFATLDQLQEPAARRAPPRPLAAITFDDGYRGVFDHALPILARKGIPAGVFVVTDRIGATAPLAHDQLYRHLRKQYPLAEAYRLTRALLHSIPPAEVQQLMDRLDAPPCTGSPELPLTWEMLAALRAAGWTVGSHTRSHALLDAASAAELAEETRGSREILERALGARVQHFAYPDGAFDPPAVSAVASAGYLFGYTTCAHRDPRRRALTQPRTMLWERSSLDGAGRVSPGILSCQSSGLLERFSGCDAARHQARA